MVITKARLRDRTICRPSLLFWICEDLLPDLQNIDKTRALIVMEAGTPVSYFQNAPVDERFVTEDMIPDEPD